MSLATVIRNAVQGDPTGDPKKIAQGLMSRFTKAELIGLLADEIADLQRLFTRDQEKVAFAREFLSKPENVGRDGVSAAFKALAGTQFALGSGLKVEWMEATVEDHRQRIAYLSQLRDGIDATIARHHAAILAIQEAGVTCLRDIADAA